MSQDIGERVRTIIADELRVPVERISLDATFESLKIDSLSAITIVTTLEDEFGIEIPNEEATKVKDVQGVISSLQQAMAKKVKD